ncbi:MAG: glycosyltransferase family 4 protein [Myxococcota bacterium]|jgi:glycosyltransferase involved in cell wall biosynthesis
MRFAMLTTFYPPHHFGGDAIFIRRLVHSLARRGHEIEVIYDADAFRVLAPQREVKPEAQPPGVSVHPLSAGSPTRGFLSTLATQQLGRPLVHGARIRELLARGRFDVVHFHNISLVGGPGVLGLAPASAVTLYMAHEHWLVCPTHVLWRHNRERCDERQCLRCVLHHKRPPQLWRYSGLLEREAAKVDVFYSPSRFSADKHAQFGFPRALEVIPYFLPDLDSAAEQPEPLANRPSDAPFFLFVGRLEKIKGLQDVIPLFAGERGEELWIVGAGDYEAELRALAEGQPRVRFLGARTPEQLRSLYAEALAVVVPSVCYETFGIILLEAFRESTPVIARRLGPFTEIVEGSGGGLLFETLDELKRGLAALAGDAAQRRALGAAGHRALLANWTESVVLEKYFEVIARIAEKKNPSLARQFAAKA